MTRPDRPGTIRAALIDPQTRQLVPLDDDRRPDGGMVVVTVMLALVFGLVAGFALAAWVLA